MKITYSVQMFDCNNNFADINPNFVFSEFFSLVQVCE